MESNRKISKILTEKNVELHTHILGELDKMLTKLHNGLVLLYTGITDATLNTDGMISLTGENEIVLPNQEHVEPEYLKKIVGVHMNNKVVEINMNNDISEEDFMELDNKVLITIIEKLEGILEYPEYVDIKIDL